jgi:membrane protein insertase Oxa1/YidC/SpoIIIJ
MTLLIVIIVIIGMAGIIGNQYSGLQRMNQMQKTLDEIKETLQQKEKTK